MSPLFLLYCTFVLKRFIDTFFCLESSLGWSQTTILWVVCRRNSAAFGFIQKSYLIHTATQNELSSLPLSFLSGRTSATYDSQNYVHLASPLDINDLLSSQKWRRTFTHSYRYYLEKSHEKLSTKRVWTQRARTWCTKICTANTDKISDKGLPC